MTADERRDAIVAAGVEEFATGGLVGASTEAIARRAGVSQPYVFQLFGTKKDLFLAVVRRCFARTRLAFEDAARDYAPARPRLRHVLEAMGTTYMRLLADRTRSSSSSRPTPRARIPDVRTSSARSSPASTGASASCPAPAREEIHHFFAEGMLLNIAAAVELGSARQALAPRRPGGRRLTIHIQPAPFVVLST